ncbi:MAG: Crp/Fnr family transcriptional regulator [Candidatus Thiodiazotropha sp. (ex Epidulcina cf. delphinae)]|nr:Crp/Fnr family transcriptional regulator [Candidatus Thiodiazotropha sp. (ex Epidulcina cf. delphinae)]
MISDPTTISKLSRQFRFLRNADADFVRRFFNSTAKITLKPSQPICQQGMQCSHLALVIEGMARVYKIGESGREITLYRIGPGESCILTASCIMNGKPFPAFAVCEQAIEALIVNTADVMRWADEAPAWRNYLFSLVNDRLSDVISIVEEIAFRRVDRRLATYLLQRTEATENRMQATHQAIASDLGTSREVVSRILKDFEQQKMISVARGKIRILNRLQLMEKSAE